MASKGAAVCEWCISGLLPRRCAALVLRHGGTRTDMEGSGVGELSDRRLAAGWLGCGAGAELGEGQGTRATRRETFWT